MTESELYRKMAAEFWDQPTCFDAKYRRIVTNDDITSSIEDEALLEQIWKASVEESLGQVLYELQPDPDWSVLEIGAGIGRLLLPLSQRVSWAYGVDVSPKMVEYAEEYLKDQPNASVFLNDGKTLSMFGDGEFDFCYSMVCFQHIPGVNIVRSYLKEIARVLKVNGTVRIQVLQEIPFWRRLKAALWNRRIGNLRIGSSAFRAWNGKKQISFEGNRYSKRDLEIIFKEADLDIVQWQQGLGRADWLWVTGVKRR